MNFVAIGSRLFYKNCIYRVILRYTLLHRNKYKAYTAIKLPRGKAGLAPPDVPCKDFFLQIVCVNRAINFVWVQENITTQGSRQLLWLITGRMFSKVLWLL